MLLLPHFSDDDKQGGRNWYALKNAINKHYVIYIDIIDGDEYKSMLVTLAAKQPYVFSHSTKIGGTTNRFKVKVGVYKEEAMDIYNNLTHQFPNFSSQVKDNAKVVVFGRAEVCVMKADSKEQSDTYYSKVRSMVAMPVTSQLIPFESSYEHQLANHLVNAGRHYEKPFSSEASIDDRLFPDFILQDCSPPVMIEVYGMNTEVYLARKKEKRAIYAAEYPGQYWEWHADRETLQDALQRQQLPAP